METIHLHQGWKFHLGDVPEAWDKRFDDSGWQTVSVPHDWSVHEPFSREHSSGTGYLPGGVGWYRLRFDLPADACRRRVRIAFDGAYRNSRVWLNGHHLGFRPNGYVPFAYDITPFLTGDGSGQQVCVRLDHREIADSRWFTGSGLVRKVRVEMQDAVHIDWNGVSFTTPTVSAEEAELRVEAVLLNEGVEAVDATIGASMRDSDGCAVDLAPWPGGDAADAPASMNPACRPFRLLPGERRTVTLTGRLPNPRLWDVAEPNLYRLETELTATADSGNSHSDIQTNEVGIRWFSFDPEKGFRLNGRSRKLKGVCVHHDAGCLGAAVPKRVWARRLQKLRDLGCNAIRMSHNPHSPELFELCDEMGFLAIAEAFDEWELPKNKWSRGHNVYPPVHQGLFDAFPEWHERDLTDMILRDRNHPSIVLWSIGNEIDYPNDPYCHPLFSEMTGNNDANKPAAERLYSPDRPNAERLATLCRELSEIVRRVDPTRPVTAAVAFPELSARIGFLDPLDVVGYNYKEHLYEQDRRRFPDKPFLGSENGHDWANWRIVADNDWMPGQFLWTGIDFLGEAHGWPIRGSMAGLLTLAGFEKPAWHFRRSLWADQPVAALVSARVSDQVGNRRDGMHRRWDYPLGERVEVRCLTNLDEAELTLNGRSAGCACVDPETGHIRWEVDFEDGVLEVKAWSRSEGERSRKVQEGSDSRAGRVMPEDSRFATDRLESIGCAAGIRLSQWTEYPDSCVDPEPGFGDVTQIEVEVTDSRGRRVPGDRSMLAASVEGPAELLGLENGDQSDLTEYSSSARSAFDGRLVAYMRRTGEPGIVRFSLRGKGLGVAELLLED